jgi:UDP-galactopyranose mutase
MFNYIIVGAGFAGAVLAERLASQQNKKVLIIDKRDHIGGNAYDYYNKDGILVHKYGPHIFHTNSKDVYEYLSQFTPWRTYYHKVLASVDGQLVPMPINLNTINQLYGLNLSSDELDLFFQARAQKIDRVKTSEDVVLNKVGKELYEKFFKGYTKKMWDLDPSELDASVTARVPTRNNRDDRYFTDTYQVMPLHGYTKMFQRMLDHPNIKIMLNTDYKEIIDIIPHEKLIYTGPIDSYFNFCFGKLPYRSLEFKMETIDAEYHQTTGTVNYPNEQAFTRVTDFKYLTGQQHPKTAIMYEFPRAEGDPYYPIPRPENAETYKKYQQLAASMTNTYFTGRLATYKYYNMDQVVAQSLTLYKKLTQPLADILDEVDEKAIPVKVDIPESLNLNGKLKHIEGTTHNGHSTYNPLNGNNHSQNGHANGISTIGSNGKDNHGINGNSILNSSK